MASVQQQHGNDEIMLSEELLDSLASVSSIFADGYLFNPFVFGDYWDPLEPLPLWDMEPPEEEEDDAEMFVFWYESDSEFAVTAELPGMSEKDMQVIVEDGKVLEISGMWNKQARSQNQEWREGKWWEIGFIRRFMLPSNINISAIEASMDNGILHVHIPKASAPAPSPAEQLRIIQVKKRT